MRSSLLRLRCEVRVQSDVAKRLRQGAARREIVDRVNADSAEILLHASLSIFCC